MDPVADVRTEATKQNEEFLYLLVLRSIAWIWRSKEGTKEEARRLAG